MEYAPSGCERDVVDIQPLALDAGSAQDCRHPHEVYRGGAVGREHMREELLPERGLVCRRIEGDDGAVELHLVLRLRDPISLITRVPIGRRRKGTYMAGAPRTIERECRALELEGHGCAIHGRDMVRALEELVAVGIAVGLDGPAIGVGEARVCVVDCEVHIA